MSAWWLDPPSVGDSRRVSLFSRLDGLLAGHGGGSGPGGRSGGSECTGSAAEPGSTAITGEVSPFLLLAWSL
jgi:hypothetical protein